MSRRLVRYPRFMVVLMAISGLAACDGDGSGGGEGDSVLGGGDANDLNAPLTGTLHTSRSRIDLETGLHESLRPFHLDRSGSLVGSANSTNAVGTRIFTFDDKCDGVRIDCVVTLDMNGSELSRVTPGFNLRTSSAPRFSPDESMFFVRSDILLDDAPTDRHVFMRSSGELINDLRINIDGMAWAPDNTIYYTRGRTLFHIARPGSQAVSEDRGVFQFDTAIGSPRSVAVSPDGTRLAVVLRTDATLVSSTSSMWMLNLETLDFHQFIVPNEIERSTNNPLWSPDGRWLAVKMGGVVGGGIGGASPSSPGSGGSHRVFDTSVRTHRLDGGPGTDGEGITHIRLRNRCSVPFPDNCGGARFMPGVFVSNWLP